VRRRRRRGRVPRRSGCPRGETAAGHRPAAKTGAGTPEMWAALCVIGVACWVGMDRGRTERSNVPGLSPAHGMGGGGGVREGGGSHHAWQRGNRCRARRRPWRRHGHVNKGRGGPRHRESTAWPRVRPGALPHRLRAAAAACPCRSPARHRRQCTAVQCPQPHGQLEGCVCRAIATRAHYDLACDRC
jgi:hypothetical protein